MDAPEEVLELPYQLVSALIEREKADLSVHEQVRCSAAALRFLLTMEEQELIEDHYGNPTIYLDRARLVRITGCSSGEDAHNIIIVDDHRNSFYHVGECYLPAGACKTMVFSVAIEMRIGVDVVNGGGGGGGGTRNDGDSGAALTKRTLEDAMAEAPRKNRRGHALYVLPSSLLTALPIDVNNLMRLWLPSSAVEQCLRGYSPAEGYTCSSQIHLATQYKRDGRPLKNAPPAVADDGTLIGEAYNSQFCSSLRLLMGRYWPRHLLLRVADDAALNTYWKVVRGDPTVAYFRQHPQLGRLDFVSFVQLLADLAYEAAQPMRCTAVTTSLPAAMTPPVRLCDRFWLEETKKMEPGKERSIICGLLDSGHHSVSHATNRRMKAWVKFMRKRRVTAWVRSDLSVDASILGIVKEERAKVIVEDKERDAKPHRGAPRKKAKVVPKHELPRGFPPEAFAEFKFTTSERGNACKLGVQLKNALRLISSGYSSDTVSGLAEAYARISESYVRCGRETLNMKMNDELRHLADLNLVTLSSPASSKLLHHHELRVSGSIQWVDGRDDDSTVIVSPTSLVTRTQSRIESALLWVQSSFVKKGTLAAPHAKNYNTARSNLIRAKELHSQGVTFERDENDEFNCTVGWARQWIEQPVPARLTLDTEADQFSYFFKERVARHFRSGGGGDAAADEEEDPLRYVERELCNNPIVLVDYPPAHLITDDNKKKNADLLVRLGSEFHFVFTAADLQSDTSACGGLLGKRRSAINNSSRDVWVCFVGVERWTPEELRRALFRVWIPNGVESPHFDGNVRILILADLEAHDMGCLKFFEEGFKFSRRSVVSQSRMNLEPVAAAASGSNDDNVVYVHCDRTYRKLHLECVARDKIKECVSAQMLAPRSRACCYTGSLSELPRFRLTGVAVCEIGPEHVTSWKDLYTYLSYTTQSLRILRPGELRLSDKNRGGGGGGGGAAAAAAVNPLLLLLL